jgi:hypothetical protein
MGLATPLAKQFERAELEMGLSDQVVSQSWVHSHEEDKGDEMIFRPSTFSFPPSRGRQGFFLNPDGTAELTGPDATDRAGSQPAEWLFEGTNTLVLKGPNQEARLLEIKSASTEKLVVKKA